MNADRRKVVLIGTGMVGMSFAYSLVNQGGICNELVLIDIDKKRAMVKRWILITVWHLQSQI